MYRNLFVSCEDKCSSDAGKYEIFSPRMLSRLSAIYPRYALYIIVIFKNVTNKRNIHLYDIQIYFLSVRAHYRYLDEIMRLIKTLAWLVTDTLI